MIDQFSIFSKKVKERFDFFSSQGELYLVDVDPDDLWEAYLSFFPEGSNPVFRERTEHDCSTCKHFVRRIGALVSIVNGRKESIWDLNNLPSPYQEVANQMSDLVHGKQIVNLFRSKERRYGIESNVETLEDSQLTWHHFVAHIQDRHWSPTPDREPGKARTNTRVFLRALEEFTKEALDTVQDLINDNAIYRGQDHKVTVQKFVDIYRKYHLIPSKNLDLKDVFLWRNASDPVSLIRNTVIGTLIQDLSTGVPLERAVSSFETKMAPENYKRPAPIVTQRMVLDATKTVEELGIEPSLARRHATLSDLSVQDVLFVDNDSRKGLKDGIEGLLASSITSTPRKKKDENLEEVHIQEFIEKILPGAHEINLHVGSQDLSKFFSLTTAEDPDSPPLFSWDNPFAWSYDGDLADSSIKARVQKAGGKTVGTTLRVSLSWTNTDDLDLHMKTPGKNHIYFGNKMKILDVDMNVSRLVKDPVENMSWTSRVPDGTYEIWVNQFAKRNSSKFGFEVEIECQGEIHNLSYPNLMAKGKDVQVASLEMKGGSIHKVNVPSHMSSAKSSVEKWGIKTLEKTRVRTIIKSPNHWEGTPKKGNLHWFFVLEGCQNPAPIRSIYNEFLPPALQPHRKVFEILGDKMKVPYSQDQLSGLGFSSTRKDHVVLDVKKESSKRTYKVIFE